MDDVDNRPLTRISPRRSYPVGYVSSSSCCSGVLVNQSAESVTSLDLSWGKGADEV